MNLVKLIWKLVSVVAAACPLRGDELVIEKNVSFGEIVSVTCHGRGNHVWLFNGKVIMDKTNDPKDIGFNTVFGDVLEETFSYLFLPRFTPENIGTYACLVDAFPVSRYYIHVIGYNKYSVLPGESLQLLCSDDSSSENVIWWYGDTILSGGDFTPADLGISNIHSESSNVSSSILHIANFTVKNEGNYSCFLGKLPLKFYTLITREPKLFVMVDGINTKETTYILSGKVYNVSCSSDISAQRMRLFLSVTWTSLEVRGIETVLERKTHIAQDTSELISWERNVLEVAITCKTHNSSFSNFESSHDLLHVIVLPEVRFQVDGKNVSGIYRGRKEQPVLLKCVAFGSRPNVTLTLRQKTVTDESLLVTKETSNKYDVSTMDYEIQQAVVLKENTIVTCENHGQTIFHNNKVNLKILISENGADENRGRNISIWIVLLVFIAAMFGIALKYRKLFLNHQDSGSQKRVTRLYSMIFDKPAFEGKHPLKITSLIHGGEIYSYWKSSTTCPENVVVAKSFTDRKVEVDGQFNINEISKYLQNLPCHHNLVNYVGRSIGNDTNFLYFEYVSGQSLREYLRNESELLGSVSGLTRRHDPATKQQHPMTFVQQIAEAILFLHSNQFCHPLLATHKVLLDGNWRCKLFDFWHLEHTSFKISNLLLRQKPPLQWLPPETKNSSDYDLASDVWSFGILLWEIYSWGKMPEQEIYAKRILDEEETVSTLPKPECCPTAIFEIMLQTWEQNTEMRPVASELRAKIIAECDVIQPSGSFERDGQKDGYWQFQAESNNDFITEDE